LTDPDLYLLVKLTGSCQVERQEIIGNIVKKEQKVRKIVREEIG